MKENLLIGYKKALLAFFIFYFTSGLLGAIFYFTLNDYFLNNHSNLIGLLKTVSYLIILLILFLFNKKYKFPDYKSELKQQKFILVFIIVICLRVVIDPIFRLNEVLGFSEMSTEGKIIDNSKFDYIKNIILFFNIVILIPLVEEIIFRGFLLKILTRKKTIWAILFSTTLFTLTHIPSNINSLLIIFIFGIIAALIALKNGLTYSIAFHIFYNFIWFFFDNIYFQNYLLITEYLNFGISYWILILTASAILFWSMKNCLFKK